MFSKDGFFRFNCRDIEILAPYSTSKTVIESENHEKLTQWGVIPILVIDVWEHSYYLYRNRRAEFVDNLFPIIIWDNVAQRFDIAVKIG